MKTRNITVTMPHFKGPLDLLPVAVQNKETGIVMLAYANKEAFLKTLETGYAHFFARSRQRLWKKGEYSGNTLRVEKVLVDCDGDAIVYVVTPNGTVCHTGKQSCFWRSVIGSSLETEEGNLTNELATVCEPLSGCVY